MGDDVTIPLDEILDALWEELEDRYSGAAVALLEKYVPEEQLREHLIKWYEQSPVPRGVWRRRMGLEP